MKRMRRLIFSLLAVLVLVGCRSTQVITGTDREARDSVRIVETVRDTTVIVREDSSMIRALIECDSLGQAHLKALLDYRGGERLKPPELELNNNILTARSEVDSLKIYLTLKDRYQERIKQEVITITHAVEVNRLTLWQRIWIMAGKFLALVAVVYCGLRIKNPFKSL